MEIQRIDKELLAGLHREAVASERRRMNFDLRTSGRDQSQRMLNALEPGTVVPVHRHTETAETTVCIEGWLDVVLYDEVPATDGAEGERKFTEVSRVTLCPKANTACRFPWAYGIAWTSKSQAPSSKPKTALM